VWGSHPQYATHAGIRTAIRSSPPSGGPSLPNGTLPYHCTHLRLTPEADTIQSFGDDLSPVVLSAPHHSTSELLRTLSRMAASKPTSWLSGQHDRLSHYRSYSGTLAVGLGCFPLDDESSHPPSHFRCPLVGIHGLVGVGKRLAPSPIQFPTSHNGIAPELNLNPFRGEPAISGFDWHFTPTHSSSVQFCNTERFAPPVRVTGPSHWPWVAHPVSGLLATMSHPPSRRKERGDALFGLAFAAPPVHYGPEAHHDEELAGSFFNRHAIRPSRTGGPGGQRPLADGRQTVSGSLSLPSPGDFSPFPRGTRALSVARCI
jgi:hypothetical protein